MKSNLLTTVTKYMDAYDEVADMAGNFERALKTKDWEFFKQVAITIKAEMQTDMFSKKFTELSLEEKDITQRTYYNINQILDFLLNPVGWTKKRHMKYQPKGKVNPNQGKEGNK